VKRRLEEDSDDGHFVFFKNNPPKTGSCCDNRTETSLPRERQEQLSPSTKTKQENKRVKDKQPIDHLSVHSNDSFIGNIVDALRSRDIQQLKDKGDSWAEFDLFAMKDKIGVKTPMGLESMISKKEAQSNFRVVFTPPSGSNEADSQKSKEIDKFMTTMFRESKEEIQQSLCSHCLLEADTPQGVMISVGILTQKRRLSIVAQIICQYYQKDGMFVRWLAVSKSRYTKTMYGRHADGNPFQKRGMASFLLCFAQLVGNWTGSTTSPNTCAEVRADSPNVIFYKRLGFAEVVSFPALVEIVAAECQQYQHSHMLKMQLSERIKDMSRPSPKDNQTTWRSKRKRKLGVINRA
jgi:hypothetical protein